MITRVSPISELKEIFAKIVLNKTSKITKISDESILNGFSFGVAKVGQKALKDISLIEAHLFVDSAYGDYLDAIAIQRGVADRYSALGSSTFIRLVGDPGTIYSSATHKFTGSHGVIFELENDVTIPSSGYTYTKVSSSSVGAHTNVDPLTISKITVALTGHKYVVNEYQALGGRDSEGDDQFRQRIKEGVNIVATGTISKLTQIFMSINSNVLRVFYNGLDNNGKITLSVISQNGSDFSSGELAALIQGGDKYFSFTDIKSFGSQENNIVLQNASYYPIDVDFRVDLKNDVDRELVRIDIQTKLSKYLDYRYWDYTKRVEWDDLLGLVKNVDGVKYVPDVYFIPGSDLTIPINQIPRFRSFIMRSLEGDILEDDTGVLNSYYYPGNQDNYFADTALINI